MKNPEPVWTTLHLPRPLDEARVLALLLSLASDRRATPVALELRATSAGVVHLAGCHPAATSVLLRHLRDHLPGFERSSATERVPVSEVGRLGLRPRELPLRTDNAVTVSRALLSAVSVPLRAGESVAVQLILGEGRGPRTVHRETPSPSQGWLDPLVNGQRPATPDERRALRQRAEDAGFRTVLRVGTHGSDPERTRRLTLAVHGALTTATGVGVRLEFVREDPKLLNDAVLPRRWPLELACAEVLGLLAWPLGDDDYPGLPSLHPKPLRPAAAVHTGERVFAQSLAPGDDRLVGVSAADSLLHSVYYGPTSSGKSTAMLAVIEASMKAGQAVAVMDPKRQLIDDVLARVPAERLDDVVVLDQTLPNPIGYNPLDATGRDPDVLVDGVMSVMSGLFKEGWGPRTSDIFNGTLRSLTRASVRSGTPATLADVPRMLTDPSFRRRVLADLGPDEALDQFWSWFENQSPVAQQAAIAPGLNKLRQLLLRPALMRTLDQRHSPFRLRDIWRENLIVLIPLNEAHLGSGTAELLGSLIVADLWQAVQERASEKNPQKRPGFIFVDEAPRFLHLPTSLGDALALSRSMGAAWALAAQFIEQFPKELRTAVDMNARTKVVFATEYADAAHFARGQKDLKTEDFMSLGKYEAYVNLVADGRPTGWSLVKTLPPSKPSIRPERVAAHSQARWVATPREALARTARHGGGEPPPDGSTVQQPAVGRKRRQP